MAFFDEISKTLSDKGKEVAQKAKETAEALQLRAQIVAEKSKLKELYGAVGVLYYKKHRDDEDSEFQDIFKEIGNILTNVSVMEEKVNEMEGNISCPSCGKVMKKDAAFCSRCGADLTREEDEAQEADSRESEWEEEPEELLITEDGKEETGQETNG